MEEENYIVKVYNLARMRGLCHTQTEFAELLGMNKSTISNAMKGGKYLTTNLTRRVELFARSQGLIGEEKPKPQEPDIIIPAATAQLYNNMSETIRIQAELIARLQTGAGVYAPAQKNYLRDGK